MLVRFGAALLKAQAYRKDNIEQVCEWLAKEVEADPATILDTKDSGEWLTPDDIEAARFRATMSLSNRYS